MTSLMYSNNADIKYPLSDFHEYDIPNDIVLDMSITVPDGYSPVLSCLRVTEKFTFISIEDSVSGLPIGSLMQSNAIPGRVYPLKMDVSGLGWIVFGPGVSGIPFYIGNVEVELDPEVILSLKQTGIKLDLTVNTFNKEISDLILLASANRYIKTTVSGNTIYLDRNDSELSRDEIVALKIGETIPQADSDSFIYTIAGTPPDENGNIDIVIVGKVSDCGSTLELEVPRGEDGGDYRELPLDIFNPKYYKDGDDCKPSNQSSTAQEAPDEYSGYTAIESIPILDIPYSNEIGSVYTIAGDSQ